MNNGQKLECIAIKGPLELLLDRITAIKRSFFFFWVLGFDRILY